MKYGLIGERLGHSFSRDIHRALLDYEYELKELPADAFDAFMHEKAFCGINVTIPYKSAVIPYLDWVDDTAREIGAVNTVVNRDGKLYGYNTDFIGLCELIQKNNVILADKKVLVLGSGGTAKTACAVARHLGCGEVLLVSRTEQDGCITYAQASAEHADAQVIINTTPCGMYPHMGESAVDLQDFPALTGVVDVVYNPLRTKLVCDAMERGVSAVGGLHMLVAQAVAAAELFTGRRVPAERTEAVYQQLYRDKENIILVGMPGCGKSTVGKALAQSLGKKFEDTDEWIVAQSEWDIPTLFEQVGESGFRDKEADVIKQVSALQGCIIATGGGAVVRPENVALLRENGRLYFLDRSPENLVATADRPLSTDREALMCRYRERYDLYSSVCDRRIVADGTIEEVVSLIREDLTQ